MKRLHLLVLLTILWAASLVWGAGTALADGTCLLSATAPGAYAVRYWPDRIVLTYDAKHAVAVTVHLPQAAKWARLDDDKLPAGKLAWDAKAGCVTVQLPAGSHAVHVAWAGAFQKAPQDQAIPVVIDGKKAGAITARFTLEKMTAEGSVPAQVALMRASLKLKEKADVKPVLTVGSVILDQWQAQGERLTTDRSVPTAETLPLSLTVASYDLPASPVEAIVLETAQAALEPKRLAAMPEKGIIIEAEAFSGEGLGKVDISEKHFQTHGGKSVFNNAGNGHWLEYKFTVAQAGTYDLYMRAATQEPADLRSIALDGQTPTGLGLIRFPGTGGWGYSAEEWAALQLTGLDKAPSLKLAAGEHTLRLTGEASTHLNLDYFMLTPR
ncbi:MAG: carbohydrate-binding protein [Armatimonadetes bacterium]|nr:carbohydrate-binding protein [Armatimonadota bacterium]